ncbi:element excision factor XisH family protein [Merismopedia glauca]|uniref:element excision factor XisH family protein n=1 Tax=Merismopedia glauca TaxID=292586 RepID=UPI0011B1CB4F
MPQCRNKSNKITSNLNLWLRLKLGQFIPYQIVLEELEPSRVLYLAIPVCSRLPFSF